MTDYPDQLLLELGLSQRLLSQVRPIEVGKGLRRILFAA